MAFLYPWGNTQQLNLDWILQKIKDLETGSGGNIDLAGVANALISATYSSSQAYDRSDIVYRDGKLYRANQAIPAPGETWTPAHWDEILLGDTVSNVVRYLAALSNDQIVNASSVTGTHTSDALDTLKNAIDNIPLDSDNISNESLVAGDNVSDALDNLDDAANALQLQITSNIETGTTASRTYAIGEVLVLNGALYVVASNIPQGDPFTVGVNILSTNVGYFLPTVSNWQSLPLNAQEQGSGASAQLYYSGNWVSINFLTIVRKHNENDVILTLPAGYRPSNNIEFVAGEGNYVLHLRIQQNGDVVVYLPSDNVSGARAYGSATFWTNHLT